ncbi:MAG TPA: MFS transporter [Burkholderiaceae bacterium]|nr:MFS transporter [Burkholderiaceae bacterium]
MSERDKRLTLVACILASIVVFLDGSVVNVALPAIREDLNAGLATQQWVVEAYLLTLGALILAGGSYADIRGRKHSLTLGVALFAATSLACAVAPNAELLIAARALQGVAGALLVPASLAVITASFEGAERGAAIGSWTAWTGIAFVIGPLAGGTIVDAISWRGVFAINIPIAAVTLVIAARGVHESKDPDAAGSVDIPAALLSIVWLGGAVFALIEQSDHGWGDPLVFVPLLAAAVALPAFLWREAHCPHPMLPLGLFKVRNFSVVNAATLTIYGGLGALTFFLVIYLQQVAGYSAIDAGLALVPVTVVMFLLSKRFGALAAKIGPRMPMTVGPLLGGAGLFMLRYVDAQPAYWTEVLPWLLLFALGLSMTVAPLTVTVLSSVSEHHAGVASGVNNATARIAGLLAIAVVGAVVSSAFANSLGDELPPPALDEARTQPLVTRVPDSVPRGQRAEAKAQLTSASVDAFQAGATLAALLVAAGGVISGFGVVNARPREVEPLSARSGPQIGDDEPAERVVGVDAARS